MRDDCLHQEHRQPCYMTLTAVSKEFVMERIELLESVNRASSNWTLSLIEESAITVQ
jgi:hypothetical protein